MLAAILGALLLGNMIAGKRATQAGEGVTRVGEGRSRAGQEFYSRLIL